MLHTKFREIGLPVPEKILRGHDGHLSHVTSIMSSDFHFLVPESFHKKIGSDRQKGFLRKSGLNLCMYTTLGQGQEMTS